jgi:lathosterol oxidase
MNHTQEIAFVGTQYALKLAAVVDSPFGRELLSSAMLLRLGATATIAVLIYGSFGYFFNSMYPRKVNRAIQPYDWTLKGDVSLALQGVLTGSPFILIFEMLSRHYGVSYAYMDISKYGLLYWAASIPVYLLVWDFFFYTLHLILHWGPVYELSHRHHHAFRPPTAWAGIAVDFTETWLSGLLPLLLPLFLMPVHLPTVYVLNIMLEGWATWLHSSAPGEGTWLTIGPLDHNIHHERGRLHQGNYSAIFTVWDRVFGSVITPHRTGRPDSELPYWIKAERAERAAESEKKAAAEKEETVVDAKTARSPKASRRSTGATSRRAGRRGSVAKTA